MPILPGCVGETYVGVVCSHPERLSLVVLVPGSLRLAATLSDGRWAVADVLERFSLSGRRCPPASVVLVESGRVAGIQPWNLLPLPLP
jgi:hypothetical protein